MQSADERWVQIVWPARPISLDCLLHIYCTLPLFTLLVFATYPDTSVYFLLLNPGDILVVHIFCAARKLDGTLIDGWTFFFFFFFFFTAMLMSNGCRRSADWRILTEAAFVEWSVQIQGREEIGWLVDWIFSIYFLNDLFVCILSCESLTLRTDWLTGCLIGQLINWLYCPYCCTSDRASHVRGSHPISVLLQELRWAGQSSLQLLCLLRRCLWNGGGRADWRVPDPACGLYVWLWREVSSLTATGEGQPQCVLGGLKTWTPRCAVHAVESLSLDHSALIMVFVVFC